MDDYLTQRIRRQSPVVDTATGESPVPVKPSGLGGLTMNLSESVRRLQCP